MVILSTSSRNNRLNLGIGGIKGQMVTMRQPEIHLWRAVDSEGNVLDILTYGDFLDCHHFMGMPSRLSNGLCHNTRMLALSFREQVTVIPTSFCPS